MMNIKLIFFAFDSNELAQFLNKLPLTFNFIQMNIETPNIRK